MRPEEAEKTPEPSGQDGSKPGKSLLGRVRTSLVSLLLLVLGWVGQDVYGAVRDRFVEPDDAISQLAERQAQAFAEVKEQLGQLGASSAGERAALKGVRQGLARLQESNQSLLTKLELAGQENQRMSKAAQQAGRAAGGYDFLLSENEGLRLDERNSIGIGRVGNSIVDVRLSSLGQPEQHAPAMRSGQSLDYRAADGRGCQVSLLTVYRDTGGASFVRSCG